MARPPEFATVTELSNLVGIKRDYVYKHLRRAAITATNRRYPVRDFLLAVRKHREEDNQNSTTAGPRAEKLKAETALLKLKLGEAEGRLLDRDLVEIAWSDLVTAFRAKLLNMPARLADILVGTTDRREILNIITAEVREALEELSNYDPQNNEGDSNCSSDVSPPTGAKNKRVGRRKAPTKQRGKRGAGNLEK